MNLHRRCLLALIAATCAVTAWGVTPYIGYVYPAGGQQGTTVRVYIGGQHINGVRDIVFTGTGVSAKFIEHEGAGGPLNAAQRDLLKQRLQELAAKFRPASANPKGTTAPATPASTTTPPATPTTTPATPATPPATPTTPPATTPATSPAPLPKVTVTLPDLPDLRNLDQLGPKELRKIADKYLNRQKRTKPPIAEKVTLEITITPDAAPGDREIRLRTPNGLTNPMIFQVGAVPELREKDREDEEAVDPPPASAPVVLNGVVMPGEVDRFTLKLRGGEKLAVTAQARHLIPYMADAVPGWFQAVIALYDASGKELAFADDNNFDPDPSFACQVPADGDYQLIIRDALYRGREDFVYRVSLSEQQPGESPSSIVSPGKATPDGMAADANPALPFIDGQLPLCEEIEPDNTVKNAQKVAVPQLIKGRIAQAGDVDLYQFTGKAGDMVVAEVYARRLGSPMDSLLRLMDATGKVLAWNDDFADGEIGLITHQADSYLSAKLPADGVYFVQVSDAQRHGGDAYNYYLRLAPPQADFALRLTPSSVNVSAGGSTTITVYAFRKDGWDGDIMVSLKDAPDGFGLKNARIPAGKDHADITLTAPQRRLDQPVTLHLEGHAFIDGKMLTRPIVPCERKMQAFAYYHLVPMQQLLVMVTRRGGGN